MSVPARDSDDGQSKDGPLNYAPKKVRHPEPAPDSAGVLPEDGAAPQSALLKREAAPRSGAAEPPEPPWRRSKQRGAFIGDVAAVELRNRLALAPDRLPEPPAPPSTGPRYGRLAGVIAVAAVGFVGYQLGSAPRSSPPQLVRQAGQSGQRGPVSERSVAAAHPNPSLDSMSQAVQPGAGRLSTGPAVATAASAAYPPQSPQPVLTSPATAKEIALPSSEQRSRPAAPPQAVSRQLTVGAVRPLHVDEATSLPVSAADAGADAAVVIDGLVSGSTFSAGAQVGPNTWRLPVEELDRAVIAPPPGFVGAMALTLELRLADNTVADRKNLQLEWSGGMNALAPAQPPPRQHDADEIALMIKTGADLMANRDFAAARLMYQRAAEAGSAMGAFALAETYDPLVVAKLNARGGITADVALAQMWYEKAKGLGSTVAPERLERLARLPESPE